MIEINLVPDVKRELLKAQRLRTTVISIAILTCIVATAIVGILSVYVFGVQKFARERSLDSAIETESQKLLAVEGLDEMLTIQNQLKKISDQHGSKQIYSRTFDVLSQMIPKDSNQFTLSNIDIVPEAKTMKLSLQTSSGYKGYEVFLKTMKATNIVYTVEGSTEPQEKPLATDLADLGGGFTEGGSGELAFSVQFTYPDELFAPNVTSIKITGPAQNTNATDSYVGVPEVLFKEQGAGGGE